MSKVMVSACLFGFNCKYDGQNNDNPKLRELLQNDEVLLVCPEQLGGLSAPRHPAEIINGEGCDVLEGKSLVLSQEGTNLTPCFVKGASSTLQIAEQFNPDLIILKSRSPSCGVGSIYDGSFTGCLRLGNGVSAELLKQAGYQIVSDEEYLNIGGLIN